MSKTIQIEMVSDFACPWCYVGKRRLTMAIEHRPNLGFELIWRPYQLNPDMPRGGRNRREYYRNKFGDQGVRSLQAKLKDAGAESGIVFCDEPDAMAPNTLSAHVLMSWAAEDNDIDAGALAEKIFHAHHVACENIGEHDVLVRIAGEVGMDRDRVATRLAAGQDEDAVKEEIHRASARGVSGVPFFVVNQRYGISGAQPAESLVAVFDEVVES